MTTAAAPHPAASPIRARPAIAHALGLVLVLGLAALLVGPRWWLRYSSPPEGTRVSINPWGGSNLSSDETLYLPTIRRAYDGDLPVSDTYIASNRGGDPQAGAAFQEVIGILGHLTGGPALALLLVVTVFAVAGMIMLYALAVEWTGAPLTAAAVIAAAFLAVYVLDRADGFLALRHWDVVRPIIRLDPQREFHPWGRFLSPVMVLPLLFGAVWSLPRAVDSGKALWMAIAAVCMALLVYAYVFYWTALGLALAGWLVWYLARRDAMRARRLALIGVIALVLALPEFAILVRVGLSETSDIKARIGLDSPGLDLSTASPVLQRLMVGSPFLYALWRSGRSRDWLYILLFLSPLVLTPVDGLAPQPWHYTTRVWSVFALPAFVSGAMELLDAAPPRITRAAVAMLGVTAVAAIASTAVIQVRAARQVNASFAVADDEHAAFAWIDSNLGKGDTVVSPSVTTNLLLASLTSSSQYMALCCYTTADDDELVGRYLRTQIAFGLSEETTFRRFDAAAGFPFKDLSGDERALEARAETYMNYFLLNWEINDPPSIERRMPRWRQDFETLQSRDDVLAPFPAQYLYCGPRERLWTVLTPPRGLYVRTAFQQGVSTVYQIVASDAPGAESFGGC